MPAPVVTGGHDFPSITERARTGAARMPRARYLHLPSMERPEEFTELLLDFAVGPRVNWIFIMIGYGMCV